MSNQLVDKIRSEMGALTSHYISLACPIAIRRFITSQLIKDVPDWFWDEDFFVVLAREHQLADIFREVQNGLTDAESSQFPSLFRIQFPCGVGRISRNKFWLAEDSLQGQVEKISCFLLFKLIKSQMSDEAKKDKFRESLRIALETTIPLNEKEAGKISFAKKKVAIDEKMDIMKDSVYEINKFSSLCNQTTRKRVLDFLNKNENCDDFESKNVAGPPVMVPMLTPPAFSKADISIIREVCSNGRYEAALTLALAQTEENKTKLLSSGVPKHISEVLKILRFPGAVEQVYLRAKTRFANYDDCKERLPNFMDHYSICFQLRCERAKIFRFVEKLPQQYRAAFEEDLPKLDKALGISDEIIIRTAFFRWLKQEHFNNVQDAKIELFDSWMEDNLEEIGLALAHRAICSAPDLTSINKELENFCSCFDYFGDDEFECLVAANGEYFPKQEIRSSLKLIMTKIPRDPAPAA